MHKFQMNISDFAEENIYESTDTTLLNLTRPVNNHFDYFLAVYRFVLKISTKHDVFECRTLDSSTLFTTPIVLRRSWNNDVSIIYFGKYFWNGPKISNKGQCAARPLNKRVQLLCRFLVFLRIVWFSDHSR